MSRRVLILGGARSGKSRYGEAAAQALAPGGALTYVATAEPGDDEMRARIAEHQERRSARWRLIESPRAPAQAVREAAAPGDAVLVDCLTLWLSNLMLDDADLDLAADDMVEALQGARGAVVLVSNELGLGLAPESALGRRFRDAQGRLNQRMAAACDDVVFVAAGLPLALKGEAPA